MLSSTKCQVLAKVNKLKVHWKKIKNVLLTCIWEKTMGAGDHSQGNQEADFPFNIFSETLRFWSVTWARSPFWIQPSPGCLTNHLTCIIQQFQISTLSPLSTLSDPPTPASTLSDPLTPTSTLSDPPTPASTLSDPPTPPSTLSPTPAGEWGYHSGHSSQFSRNDHDLPRYFPCPN